MTFQWPTRNSLVRRNDKANRKQFRTIEGLSYRKDLFWNKHYEIWFITCMSFPGSNQKTLSSLLYIVNGLYHHHKWQFSKTMLSVSCRNMKRSEISQNLNLEYDIDLSPCPNFNFVDQRPMVFVTYDLPVRDEIHLYQVHNGE